MRGVSQYPDGSQSSTGAKGPAAPSVMPGGTIPIPTQPVDMGKSQETKRREEIMVLVILSILVVALSVGAFIAVNILRQFSGSIFTQVEKSGISVSDLKSLGKFRQLRVGGRLAAGLLLAIAFLSRGVTTLLYAIVWGAFDLVTVLVTISFIRNSAKKKPANALEVVAVIVGLFAALVTIYMPIEIYTHFRDSSYWIPGTDNYLSLWVMLPTIIWGIYLLIYFICSVIYTLEKHRNTVTEPGTGGVS